jgi:hypothetical protein
MRSEWQPDGNRLCADQSDSRQFKERELGEYRMGSILVRDLDQKTSERLKERAHLKWALAATGSQSAPGARGGDLHRARGTTGVGALEAPAR